MTTIFERKKREKAWTENVKNVLNKPVPEQREEEIDEKMKDLINEFKGCF